MGQPVYETVFIGGFYQSISWPVHGRHESAARWSGAPDWL